MVSEFLWRTAQAAYMVHLFGGSNYRGGYLRGHYRGKLILSIEGHMKALAHAINELGVTHPTTLEIWASLQLCFEEQVDWTLDDIPREHIDALDEIPRPPGHKVFWK